MKNIFRIPVGDPSDDGHGKCDYTTIECNKTKEEVKEAYEKSCLLTGLTFTSNSDIIVDGHKISWEDDEYDDRNICVEYQSSEVSELANTILEAHGILRFHDLYVDELVILFMSFVKLSLPDLEYNVINNPVDTLNITIGYGLFD